MTRRSSLFVLLSAFLLLLPPSVRSDAPPPSASPPTLAQALAAAPPPKEDVYLAVAADKVLLRPGAAPPQKDDPASQVAQSYGRIIHEFGGVMAVAPPTMTVLNTNPDTPNPYNGMPPGDALKLLLASLSDAQWKTLTGMSGLGMGDLAGDTQHALFGALFPTMPLSIHPRHEFVAEDGNDDKSLPKLTPEDVAQAHLRLGQRVRLTIPVEDNGNGAPNTAVEAPSGSLGGTVQYELPHGSERRSGQDSLYGVPVRATVPNTPKASDLDYDAKALRARVSFAGAQTAGNLIARLGAAAKLEMYADPRYEKRNVTVFGPASARAADLLRALALCVAGTYRKVGPAYVLTDDLIGLGTRRMILTRFTQNADAARREALDEAADQMIATRDLDRLPPLDSGLSLSDAQKAEAAKDPTHVQGMAFTVNLPFAQLTPPQQELARRSAERWNADPPSSFRNDRLTLTQPVTLQTQPTLTLETPAISGAILLDGYFSVYSLFHGSNKTERQQGEQRRREAEASAPPPALAPLMSRQPRRAVLARPRTAKEVGALVAAMKTVGLNALWLDVFSGGVSHLNGDPDILTEALKQMKGMGITVLPVLDLLRWGGDAPEDARDRTLLGETSAQAGTRRQRYEAVTFQGKTSEEADHLPAPVGLSVCPALPSVQKPLADIVRRLAETEGVAGIVLRDAVTPGYDHPDGARDDERAEPMGYAPALRLAFLRRTHADPVDLIGFFSGPDTRLPDFDDNKVTEPVQKEWSVFRAGAGQDLLQGLADAAWSAPSRKPILWIEQRAPIGQEIWIGLWGHPLATLPTLFQTLTNARFHSEETNATLAHAQCQTNLYELPADAAASPDALALALRRLPPGWDGFVLDLSGDVGGSALIGLAKSLTPPGPGAAKLPQK